MSASFIERCTLTGDYENDGGNVDLGQLQSCLVMYEAGIVNAAFIKTCFSCTTAQGEDVNDILATMPSVLLTILNGLARARWTARIIEVLRAGQQQWSGFTNVALIKGHLGIS